MLSDRCSTGNSPGTAAVPVPVVAVELTMEPSALTTLPVSERPLSWRPLLLGETTGSFRRGVKDGVALKGSEEIRDT